MRALKFAYRFSYGSGMTTDNARAFSIQLLFDELSVKAHVLEHLTIDGIDQLSFLLAFSVCNRLRKIHLTMQSSLDPTVFMMFASLKSLTELTLNGFDMSRSTSFIHLAALKCLYLTSDTSSLIHFLKSVLLPEIQSLRIDAYRAEDPDGIHTLSASMADCCAETLLLLEINNHAVNGTSAMILVEPLLRMRHLRSVKIDDWSSPLSDQELQRLAEAWPKLSAIDLTYDADTPQEPHLHSLIHFTTLCPDLRLIHIVPLSTVPLPDLDPSPILSHGLQLISFDHPSRSPIPDPRWVALFLDRTFPNIDVAGCERLLREADTENWEEASNEDWEEVLTHLSDFQLVRNQQDIRAGRA
ncbi:uncharacterized protein LAESUDRAFT_729443 [Laetiporus sulphureus 93-53]|uniref:F-box domain-containing protein n=1 Tax=Laetiporus sulphureus 93-53 TaxID=1314785 RepID=A0A165CPI6_9APHY|nr:uncharacterized protein LAESUDRAFT_729443 [Laetiporus sulphureus 93-53]KZT03184.1 hypothetical protein LAESUDRAFT_729443 [Laetiporus sulphureus 93-53]